MSQTDNLPKLSYDDAIAAMRNILEYFTTRPTEQAAAAMAIEALQAQKTAYELANPKPLTLDELKSISGQYIFTKVIHGKGIKDGTIRHKLWLPHLVSKTDFDSYGTDWLAYRTRPPEGV